MRYRCPVCNADGFETMYDIQYHALQCHGHNVDAILYDVRPPVGKRKPTESEEATADEKSFRTEYKRKLRDYKLAQEAVVVAEKKRLTALSQIEELEVKKDLILQDAG